MALVDGSSGSVSAQYEYGPFGEVLRATGTAASANPFRFSTKYADAETGLLDYGYRYYNSSTGRWLSRDPIEERGGADLYAYVKKTPGNVVDPFGLIDWGTPGPIPGVFVPGTGIRYDIPR